MESSGKLSTISLLSYLQSLPTVQLSRLWKFPFLVGSVSVRMREKGSELGREGGRERVGGKERGR